VSVHPIAPERERRELQDRFTTERLTDAGLAERFAETYRGRLLYNHRRKDWYAFNPPVFRPDPDGQVYRCAIEFVRQFQADALTLTDRKLKEQALAFALRCESKPSLDRLVGLASKLLPLADAGDGWDADPWLLAAPNGVIDLRSGELRAGTPDDRLTMMLGVPFDQAAYAPRFLRFLEEIFSGDTAVIGFIQRYVGYALSGLTSEQVCAIAYGTGSNGKTTLINVLAYIFGDYWRNVPFSTLERQGRAAIPNDVAVLDGKRFVTASETNDGVRLNEARLKALTGGDPISARFLYGETFTFTPQAKFLLAVNHKPLVHDDSFGFWRRILLIPFLRCFTGSAKDDTLADQLKAEGSGILAWAVAGCLAWQRDGLQPPAAVLAATDEYRGDSDPLGDFLAECCDLEPGASVAASTVQQAYLKWAEKQGFSKHDRLSPQSLSQRLADRFPRRKTRVGWSYDGFKVATERLF
jgi:putative DNA primase/helicase